MQNRVIAVFGGAFNPVHFGHIKPAVHLLQHDEISRLIFMPSCLHPHKGRIADDCSDAHRLAMLELVARPPRLQVDTCEMRVDKVAYTVNTLRYFRAELGEDVPLAFVLGEDAFNGIDCWRDYQQLQELAHLIVIRRSIVGIDAGHPLLAASGGYVSFEDLPRSPAGRICQLDNELIAVSSTEVRKLLRNGQQPRYMMPGMVWNYIRRNRLYGYDGA